MVNKNCWTIENYVCKPCPQPAARYPCAVSPHNHSNHSIETMGFLNQVAAGGWVRPWKGILQASFGLAEIENLDYKDIFYRSPLSVEEVLATESDNIRNLGFENALVGITDHDEISGSQALRQAFPEQAALHPLGEELSIDCKGHLFHLGVMGLKQENSETLHADLQAAAHEQRLDDLFDMLASSGALVILNHPLVPWKKGLDGSAEAMALLARYTGVLHALEYNGMRSEEENQRVLALAQYWKKPVVGGGDSHLLLASSVLSVTRATSFEAFAAEVKEGQAVPLILPTFFAPLSWKLFLRVLYFMGHYRRIGHFRGQPVCELLQDRTVLLDAVGWASRGFLAATNALGLIR